MAIANLRKAAVLLLSLPQEQVAELLGRLEPDQAAAVTAEMAGLREVAEDEQQAVVLEFAGVGGRGPQCDAAPFQFLHGLHNSTLLNLIDGERPQTIALVLSCLPPRQAAEALAEMAPDRQLAVMCRIAATSAPSPEIVLEVERTLRRRLDGTTGAATGNCGVAGAVRMLNAMPPAAERRLLGELAKANPQLAQDIRRAMFGVDVAACQQWDVVEAAG